MKAVISVLSLVAALVSFGWSSAAHADLRTVPMVDVGRYIGDWYEISHNPLFFEGGPCACTRQRLTVIAPGTLGVWNSCNDANPSGKLRDIKGIATSDDRATNARFTVDFQTPIKGTYWIIGLDPEYRFAVVSDQLSLSLYILSRTPTLAPELYAQAAALAKEQVDTSKLVITAQAGCQYP